nr:hypothetical protein [uncultured Flavobacterium sp.]
MKPVLIFSGANDRAIISFCRYAESKKIYYAIIANGNDDLIFLTDYKGKVIATREKNHLSIDKIVEYAELIKTKFSSEEVFILPSTEFLNRFLLSCKDSLDSFKISFGLCDNLLYSKISDKYEFGKLCHRYAILTPKEYQVKPNHFPYVAKPKKYFDKNQKVNTKPFIIYNKEVELDFLKSVDVNEFYFQEYVSGKSIYLLFYFFRDKTYSVFSQENYVQQSNGGSMIFSQSSNYHLNSSLVKPFSELFTQEGFHGLVMVEVKEYKDQFYMIEANPRLWGPSQLILDSNMTLFDDFSIENNLVSSNTIEKKRVFFKKELFLVRRLC